VRTARLEFPSKSFVLTAGQVNSQTPFTEFGAQEAGEAAGKAAQVADEILRQPGGAQACNHSSPIVLWAL
jgi:hypothetical protein